MGWILKLLALGGGPLGWLTAVGGFVVDVVTWCIRNWKITLPIAIVLGSFYGGMRYERSGWQKKEAVRVAKEKADEEQRIRTNHDLQITYEHLDAQAAIDKAAREKKYQALEERLKNYVASHSDSSCGVGDDGLQLIVDTVRSRRTDHR